MKRKLPLHPALTRAHSVLAHIRVGVPCPTGTSLGDVTGYENGREHGLSVTAWLRGSQFMTICWAEYRNTDEIAVYVGQPGEHFANGLPTDRAWADHKAFQSVGEAAKYISQELDAALSADA